MDHQGCKVKVSFIWQRNLSYFTNIFQRSGAATEKALVAMLLLTLETKSKSELDD